MLMPTICEFEFTALKLYINASIDYVTSSLITPTEYDAVVVLLF